VHHRAAPAADSSQWARCRGQRGPSGGWAGLWSAGLRLHQPVRGLSGELWCLYAQHMHIKDAVYLASVACLCSKSVGNCPFELSRCACMRQAPPGGPLLCCLCRKLCSQESAAWLLRGCKHPVLVCMHALGTLGHPCVCCPCLAVCRRVVPHGCLHPTCACTCPNCSPCPSCHSCTRTLPPSLWLSAYTCFTQAKTVSRTPLTLDAHTA
jgi:hypothetical protein